MDLKPILQSILEVYLLPLNGHHGVAHWARVLENGLRLADETRSCSFSLCCTIQGDETNQPILSMDPVLLNLPPNCVEIFSS
jgi:hypothetical protein